MAASLTDIRSAAAELREIVGDTYVIHRPEDLIVFEYDGSVDRAMPQLVVLPGDHRGSLERARDGPQVRASDSS